MKYIVLIGDGMADNPIEALGGKTPLQAADKPFLDALCADALLGEVRNVPQGLPPGSDTAILSIFGCDPKRYFKGRSPLEAAGCGVQVQPGEVSYRCNMITLSDEEPTFAQKRILSHNAGAIDGADSDSLIGWLCEQPAFRSQLERLRLRIVPTHSFRHIAVQPKPGTACVPSAPPHDHLGEAVGDLPMHGSENADGLRRLMELANELLTEHPYNAARKRAGLLPCNGIWLWAEGEAGALPSFAARYGHTGSVISAVPLVHGIARLCGLRAVSVEGATGEVDTNYEGKLEAARRCLRSEEDFLCLHIEAPDEATHNGRLEEKLLAIRQLDERVTKPLVEFLRAQEMDFRLLVLSDHKTLMATRGHDGDPVPFFLYDSRVRKGSGLPYTEENGALGQRLAEGTALLPLLFEEPAGKF